MTRKTRNWIAGSLLVLLAAAGTAGYVVYRDVFEPNTEAGPAYLLIPTGAGFSQVVDSLTAKGILRDRASFEWVADRMNYKGRVLPGRYRIRNGMSNKDLVLMLRAGEQEPVHVVFNNIRLRQQLAARVASEIEADSASLMALLTDNTYLGALGFDTVSCLGMFIPNTYEFYWNTSADAFVRRMEKEYRKFWNADRVAQAREAALAPDQVVVLASIVEQETRQDDEKPMIAGVYMNRYRKGWKLEADPTLVYALGDFSVRRVLNQYKEIDSPYNTYKFEGLPPGPICLPSISSIDAVLHYAHHSYMYFCARHDFSGYHVFARTYSEHLANAHRFHRELNRRNINS